jgi:hypothetical protein
MAEIAPPVLGGGRRAGPVAGVWWVATVTFAPLIAACAVAVFVTAPPLVTDRRSGVFALAGAVVGWLAFAGCGFIRTPRRPLARMVAVGGFAVLALAATYAAGTGAFVLGRLEAHSAPVVMVFVAAAAVGLFVLAASAIPRLHAGVDPGNGLRTLPYLGIFGAVAVPILSGPHDFVADKVDGWIGIGVLAGIGAVLLATATGLVNVVHYVATGRLQRRFSSRARLGLWTGVWFAAAMALALVFRE